MNKEEGKFLCVGLDITESIEEEYGSAELPDILETVTEHLPSGVVILDTELKIKFANSSAIEMLVLDSRKNWFNRCIKDFFAGKLVGDNCVLYDYVCPFDLLLKNGNAFYGELFCSWKDDGVGYVNVSASLSRDATGKVTGIVCTLEDCTEITKTRRLLEKSENKYRRLTELSPMGIVVHENMNITYINPAGAEILGYEKPEEALGVNMVSFVPEHERENVNTFTREMISKGRPVVGFERTLINNKGKQITVKMSSQSYESGGGMAVQSVFRNITEEKKRSEEI
jgi:PAS domain S-box-containing protein